MTNDGQLVSSNTLNQFLTTFNTQDILQMAYDQLNEPVDALIFKTALRDELLIINDIDLLNRHAMVSNENGY